MRNGFFRVSWDGGAVQTVLKSSDGLRGFEVFGGYLWGTVPTNEPALGNAQELLRISRATGQKTIIAAGAVYAFGVDASGVYWLGLDRPIMAPL